MIHAWCVGDFCRGLLISCSIKNLAIATFVPCASTRFLSGLVFCLSIFFNVEASTARQLYGSGYFSQKDLGGSSKLSGKLEIHLLLSEDGNQWQISINFINEFGSNALTRSSVAYDGIDTYSINEFDKDEAIKVFQEDLSELGAAAYGVTIPPHDIYSKLLWAIYVSTNVWQKHDGINANAKSIFLDSSKASFSGVELKLNTNLPSLRPVSYTEFLATSVDTPAGKLKYPGMAEERYAAIHMMFDKWNDFAGREVPGKVVVEFFSVDTDFASYAKLFKSDEIAFEITDYSFRSVKEYRPAFRGKASIYDSRFTNITHMGITYQLENGIWLNRQDQNLENTLQNLMNEPRRKTPGTKPVALTLTSIAIILCALVPLGLWLLKLVLRQSVSPSP
jgi:hypothetical protein